VKSRAAFPLLQLANAVSGVSNGVVMITVPWIVLEETGSAGRAGLLAALVSIPGVVVSPIVGGLIDRLGRRLVSVISDLMSLVSVLLFVLVNALGDLTYWWIVGIAIFGAVFDPAGYTARKSLIPNAATASGVSVDAANGRHEGLFAIGWMVGPAIGAACIEWSGPMASFIVTAFFFAIAAVAVSNMKVNDEHGKSIAHEHDGHEPFFSSLRGGFQVITGDRALLGLTITFVILSGLYMPIDTVIFPAHFESIDDPSWFVLLRPAFGAIHLESDAAHDRRRVDMLALSNGRIAIKVGVRDSRVHLRTVLGAVQPTVEHRRAEAGRAEPARSGLWHPDVGAVSCATTRSTHRRRIG
jgi:MFS family permease